MAQRSTRSEVFLLPLLLLSYCFCCSHAFLVAVVALCPATAAVTDAVASLSAVLAGVLASLVTTAVDGETADDIMAAAADDDSLTAVGAVFTAGAAAAPLAVTNDVTPVGNFLL